MSKKITFTILSIVLIGLTGCSNQQINKSLSEKTDYQIDKNDFKNPSELIKDIPLNELNETEKEGLIQMREEEKLARDVYQYLYTKWQMPIFNNIAQSEQVHTDAVKNLLERYNINDPVKDDSAGVFTSTEMQDLYNKLTSIGTKSSSDALKVGATIEDLDIKDLTEFLKSTDNEDIKTVYQNLMKGSRNHLRAFDKNIKLNGENYIPQYITIEEYNSIINNSTENYQVDSQGKTINSSYNKQNQKQRRY